MKSLALLALLALLTLTAHASEWPEIIVLLDDNARVTLESRFSIGTIVDCPDYPPTSSLFAYEASGGTMTITPDPGVGPPLVLRYGARYYTERNWPELLSAVTLVALVGDSGAKWDGGFSAGMEDCATWVKP